MNYIIRNIQINDYYKNYLQLLSNLSPSNHNISFDDFSSFVNNLHNNHQIFVIELNDTIIASITILFENKLIHNLGKVCHIEDVVVDKSFQKLGFGKILLNKAIELSYNIHCYKIILNCSLDNKQFYEKFGFIYKNIQMSIYNIDA